MYADFGYMEEGKLGKAYDLKLMARLWVFLQPHWLLMAVSLLFVLVMAGLDLVIPYLTKEAIDRYVVVSAREVLLKGDHSREENQLLMRVGKSLVPSTREGRFFLLPQELRSLDAKETALFQKYGLFSERRFYVFSVEQPEVERVLKKYPSLFEPGGSYWFIPFEKLKEIEKEDLRSLRARDVTGVFRIAAVVLVILTVHFVLNFFQVYAMEVAGQRMMHGLRMKLFSHLQGLSVSFFDRNPVGRLVTRLTNDIQNIHEMFTSALIHLFKDLLLLFGIIVLLLYLNRELALVSFSVLPLIFVTTLFFSRQARDAFREIRFKIAEMNAFLQENFSGIRVVQLFQRQKENGRRFHRINESHYLANMRQIRIYAFFVPLVEILSSGAIGLLLWYGGGKVIQERITLGGLVAFLSYIRMFFQPIRDLSEKYNILQSAMASLERIFSLLDQDERVSQSVCRRTDAIRGNIEFRNVSFSYNGVDRVLHNVSFSVRQGETVAIVGATGAGKTSLLHLLERFYDPQEGTILLDGMDLQEIDLHHLRSQIGLVMQDTFLFAEEVEENIRLGDQRMDGERVRAVARLVNADKFIERLPQGYYTKVGEGGEELSAGEKQLLAFARALYIDPRILVFDEATSHVDPQTERFIQEGLEELLKGRTAIVIAHRLSTIRRADRIVVLHKGRVREVGTHAELIAKRGLYYRLYRLQFGETGLARSIEQSG